MEVWMSLMLISALTFGNNEAANINTDGVTSPNIPADYGIRCGYIYYLPIYRSVVNGEDVPIYYLNTTANRLASEGFVINEKNVVGDLLYGFSYSNGTYNGTYEISEHTGISSASTFPTAKIKSYFMAHFGVREGSNVKWLCEGIIINKQWILSSANCFSGFGGTDTPNFVRVGEFDLTKPPEEGKNHRGKFIYEYDVLEPISHPLYEPGKPFHDLALIRLPRRLPKIETSTGHICLPWDSETNKNLKDTKLFLTSWAFSQTDNPISSIMQEVPMIVLNSTDCQKQYSTMLGFDVIAPNGLPQDEVLCARPVEQDKQTYSCSESSSGAPVVYLQEDEDFFLAGITTSTFGCGDSKYPGVFVPINKPVYLQWIKDTAFANLV